MKVVRASDGDAFAGLFDIGWYLPGEMVAEVGSILVDVRKRGDEAVIEYARRFDHPAVDESTLRVPIPMLENARKLVTDEAAAALELAGVRITRFHERQRQSDVSYVEGDGTRYAVRRSPLQSVAVYAPRTAAASAILMGALPAKIAGVARVIVISPAAAGVPAPAVLFASALCGVDELYGVGGAHGIAAAAFGTQSVARVDKIVGRAGLWATEAKRQVFGRCGVDSLAGPAELLVVADDGANSEYVVGELLAQSELPGVTRIAALSESRSLLEAVAQLIDTLDLRTLERHEFVRESIETHCRLIEARTRAELLNVVNRFAPAYLSLQVRDASDYLDRIHTAGTIFVGDMTPLVSGAYLAGTSHVAPASGTARFASCLSLGEFIRTFNIVQNTAERIVDDAPALALLAELDGLPHHAQTARLRCGS